MNCIIIDDEAMARAIIAQLISNYPEMHVVGTFSNAIDAIKYLNQNQDIDVLFLDIHMPDFTGFDLIQTIKNPPKVILVTADKNFAFEAFEYECIVDYLVKPISFERFDKAVNKLQLLTESGKTNTKQPDETVPVDTPHEFYINIDRRLIKIEFALVNVVEAKGDYILIKTEAKNYTVHTTLKKIEDKLPADVFLKVHRSFIINIKKIIDIENNSVLIAKELVPVSRANRSELMKRLNLL